MCEPHNSLGASYLRLCSLKQSAQIMDESSGQDRVRFRATQRKTSASASASALFIRGFGLLKTNDAEAILWASNELFIHLMKWFYWRTQPCLTLGVSVSCVGILFGTHQLLSEFYIGVPSWKFMGYLVAKKCLYSSLSKEKKKSKPNQDLRKPSVSTQCLLEMQFLNQLDLWKSSVKDI